MAIKIKIHSTNLTEKRIKISVIDNGTDLIKRYTLPLHLTEEGEIDHEKNNKMLKEIILFYREKKNAPMVDMGKDIL